MTTPANTTPAIGPFRFSVQSVAEAERHLGMKLPQIIGELSSDDGMALRTLVALVAAGSPPPGSAALLDHFAATWFDSAILDAPRLIRTHGTTAVAEAIGPAFGSWLATIGGPNG